MPLKNSTKQSHKLGHTEASIRDRAASTKGRYWTVHCPNGAAHKNNDNYDSETGYYRCRVRDLKGFAADRDRPDWQSRQTRTYSNGVRVIRDRDGNGGKKIWQENTRTKIQSKPYLHEAIHANTKQIYIVEGEKCAEALQPHLDHQSE